MREILWGSHDFKEGKIPFSNKRELIKISILNFVVVDAKSLSTIENDERKHRKLQSGC